MSRTFGISRLLETSPGSRSTIRRNTPPTVARQAEPVTHPPHSTLNSSNFGSQYHPIHQPLGEEPKRVIIPRTEEIAESTPRVREAGLPYKSISTLGRGGMGSVQLVEIDPDESLPSSFLESAPVARKEARDDRSSKECLQNEATILADLTKRIAEDPTDFTEVPFPFFLHVENREEKMVLYEEYIRGKSLYGLLMETQRLPWRKATQILKQLLLALQYIHTKGYLHRDIKPENILIQDDETDHPNIIFIDFGTATKPGIPDSIAGTIAYMSPEQLNGHESLEQRSDIFSLGTVFYLMLTGGFPFHNPNFEGDLAFADGIIHGIAPPFGEHIPRELEAIFKKMTHKNPEPPMRYQNCEDILRDLAVFESKQAPSTQEKEMI